MAAHLSAGVRFQFGMAMDMMEEHHHGVRGTHSRPFVERRFQQTTISEGSCSVVGGYQYTFLDPDHAEQFLCVICRNVAKDIYQVTCCGQHFCKECLQNCRRTRGECCPHCRRENLQSNHFPDTSAKKMVLSLMVKCPMADNGCSWKGDVRSVECHNSQCDYTLVRCVCGKEVMKRDQEKHNIEECGLRMTNCQDCNQRGNYTWLETHEGNCPAKLVNCPNQGCDVMVKRCELAEHQKVCAKEKVACQHSWLGCKEVLPRENQTVHDQQDLVRHLEMAEARIKQLENPNRDEFLCSKVQRVPITFRIESFQNLLEQKQAWKSDGFYSDVHGYKMCLMVHLNGTGCGADSHISYFLHLMPGAYDEELPWPFQGKIVVHVLNQLEDTKHSRHEKQFLSHVPTEYNKRVCGKAMNEVGLGEPRFFPHRDLAPKEGSNINYVKDGSLYIQVSKIEVYSVPQSWLRGYH